MRCEASGNLVVLHADKNETVLGGWFFQCFLNFFTVGQYKLVFWR